MGAASPAPVQSRSPMPCQEDFDAYMKCCKDFENTQDMVDCETITYKFRQCMEKQMAPSPAQSTEADPNSGDATTSAPKKFWGR
mmetsp:Transcript_128775/g.181692  ORF Transcript_128775/g.181692 Transcript_128775/m.181692 type:complete len:84 (+) Transcript_128775:34-285(+)